MSIISFNGNYGIPQPSTLKEETIRHVHDRVSITGVARRVWMADKKQVVMGFSALTQAQFSTLEGYIYNEANPVTYYNVVTGFGFRGFVTASQDVFLPGDSWLKNVTITILEL